MDVKTGIGTLDRKKLFKKRIYQHTLHLVGFIGALPDKPTVREIKSQVTRSGTSIAANYFEAEAASSRKDYQNFFSYALKSANETVFWLSLIKDGGFSRDLKLIGNLIQETQEIAKILAASIITIKKNS